MDSHHRTSARDSLFGLNTTLARIVILQLIDLLDSFRYTYLMCCSLFTIRKSLLLYVIHDKTSGDKDSKEATSKKITTAVWHINNDEPKKKDIINVSLT